MQNSIRLIVVPYHLAKLRTGMGRGPGAYLQAGAVEQLRAAGHDAQSEILLLENEFTSETEFLLALNQRITIKVRETVSNNQFPFITLAS